MPVVSAHCSQKNKVGVLQTTDVVTGQLFNSLIYKTYIFN